MILTVDYCLLIKRKDIIMILKTYIFNYAGERYRSMAELAEAMGISVSQVYKVKRGNRSINNRFIIGAAKAFPDKNLGNLFYLSINEDN